MHEHHRLPQGAGRRRNTSYVRSLPSAASGMIGVQAHHHIGGRFSQRKVSDFEVMPITPTEHARNCTRAWMTSCGIRPYGWE